MTNARMLLPILFLIGCAAAIAVPLPENIRVAPPHPSVPREIAAFSGKWVGSISRLQRTRDHVLVVEEIVGANVVAIYALGSGQWIERTLEARPFWVRAKGRFQDGTLRLFLPNGATVTYQMRADGTINGREEYGGEILDIHLTRAKD